MPLIGNNPRNGSWERQFEMGLPDCRLSYLEREKARVPMTFIGQSWDTVFCALCHKPYMAVPPDCPHVFYICEGCFLEQGAPPDCVQVSGS
jgi:hypothetical protein